MLTTTEERAMKYLWWFCALFGTAGIVFVRVSGLHMTEGELFMRYWLHFCIYAASVMVGVFMLSRREK